MNCKYCDNPIPAGVDTCPGCGAPVPRQQPQPQAQPQPQVVYQQAPQQAPAKSRAVYIVLALLLGQLGIHNFYIGRIGAGVVQLLITLALAWCGVSFLIVGIWVLVELFTVKADGNGVPLA